MNVIASRCPTASYRVLAAISVLCVVVFLAPGRAGCQTFNVIHTFSGNDGLYPQSGVTLDSEGNLYGTTVGGGSYRGGYCESGCGTVFKMQKRNSTWIFTPLYNFHGDDGLIPSGRVTIATDGTLYGVTNQGGRGSCQFGCGTAYHLTPSPTFPRSALAPWNETVIAYFDGATGSYPTGDVSFDQQGNFYVTAGGGGPTGNSGALYQFTPSESGWVSNLVYAFTGLTGANPTGGVVIDRFGALYGTTQQGGRNAGVIYRVSWSGTEWQQSVLYDLGYRTGLVPIGGLLVGPSGVFYGTTTEGGKYQAGTVFAFEMGKPLKILTDLPARVDPGCPCGPEGKLVLDRNGDLYGTVTAGGVYGVGTVFKLTPGVDGWTYTSLHDFTGQTDPTGAYPSSSLVLGADGHIYGTASEGGGSQGGGTVFEIIP